MNKKVFLVHKWETTDDTHHLHIWNGTSEDPATLYFKDWSAAFEKAYEIAALDLGLDYFQVDHPDFPHKFIKIMRTEE
jgi:hypothetical protein